MTLFHNRYGMASVSAVGSAGYGMRLPVWFGRAVRIAGITVAVILTAALSAQAQNLVQNPGFEDSTSDTTSPGWTLTPGYGTSFYNDQTGGGGGGLLRIAGNGLGNAYNGIWSAEFGATDANSAQSGTLSQVITTAPNSTYLVTFFLMNTAGAHNTFLATFDGQTILSLTDSSAFGYTQYSVQIRATSNKSVLAFTAEQDPGFFYLDDVSVVLEGAPAPVAGGGLLSFVLAIGGLTAGRIGRNRRRLAKQQCDETNLLMPLERPC